MSRVEENRELIKTMFEVSKNQQKGTYQQIVSWNSGNIASFLMDISKSLAVIADSCVKEEEKNANT